MKLSKKWRDILNRIPGYDPFRDADVYTFDKDAADKVIRFFPEYITHVKGALAGEPYVLEPHEESIVANLFGWKDTNGLRRYREVFYLVARKNSKSTFAAGLILFVIFTDGEAGAELYSTAADRDQARLVFSIAKQMVLNNETLSGMVKIYTNAITVGSSTYKAISAEANTKHGYNTHLAMNDELHAHKTPELVNVIQTSMGARTQPISMHITTQDSQRPGSICLDKYRYACQVRDGIIRDAAFLPVIYEVTIEMLKADPEAWKRPEMWALANPNMGKSVSLEYLQRECNRAVESPVYENTFKRLHLNMITEQAVRWLAMDKWNLCGVRTDPIDWRKRIMEELEGKRCYAAIDLGSVSDLTALVLLFVDSGIYTVLPFFWVPEEGARQKEKKHKVPYLTWMRQGFLETTEGDVTDYDYVCARIQEINDRFPFSLDDETGKPQIAIDRLFQGAQTSTDLQNLGFEVKSYGQGFMSMAAPTKRLQELVLSGCIRHGSNPILDWMASNVCIKTDPAGNMKPVKPLHEEAAKIDGIVAFIMSLGRAMLVHDDGTSVYDSGGVFSITAG